MKKTSKIAIIMFSLFILAGCTNNFCTNADKANIMSAYANEVVDSKTREKVIVDDLKKDGVIVPSDKYFEYLEAKIYEYAITDNSINNSMFVSGDKNSLHQYTIDELKTLKGKDDVHDEEVYFYQTSYYASVKFAGHSEKSSNVNEQLWYNFDEWTKDIQNKVYANETLKINETTYDLSLDDLPSEYFISSYKEKFNTQISSSLTCITPKKGIYSNVILEGKSWGKAFSFGLIEGLIEYPIAWMIDGFYNLFNAGAVGAIFSILIVTVIVRLFLLLVTFKSTLSQTRMQEMQPEMAKIQAKYPNANTNNYEKQQMAQEQMALYKKYKVNPFSMIIVMIFQFPIFIAVWGAMSGSAVLRLDTLFASGGKYWALSLSSLTSNEILSGNISAIILFIVMSAVQILSVKLPAYLTKRDNMKNAPKLGKNPAQDQSAKQANMMSNIMMIMIIVMGFTLPVAMAVYWVISALIALAQSLIIRAISKNKTKQNGFVKYKNKNK